MLRAVLYGALLLMVGGTQAVARDSPSDGMGDRDVHALLLTHASDRCRGYKGAFADTLARLDVSLARQLLDHHVLACPDPALDSSLAVVWYGNHRAITWNPNDAEAPAVLDKVVRRMAKADDFSDELQAFDRHGTLVTGQLLPAFETRCTDEKDCANEEW